MTTSQNISAAQLFLQQLDEDVNIEDLCTDNGIVLYGFGELGKLALSYCLKTDIKMRFLLDQNCNSTCTLADLSLNIYNPKNVFPESLYSIPVAVCVATSSYETIKTSLMSMGWKNIFPFYQLTRSSNTAYPLSNGWLTGKLSKEDKSKINYVIDNLEDDCSIEHYKSFINWHISYREQINTNFPIITSNRYNIDPIKDFLNAKSHSIIDVGAHNAQLLDIMLSERISIQSYYALEPDPNSSKKIEQKFSNLMIRTVVDRRSIASQSHSSRKFFAGLNYCSKLSPHGNLLVESVAIDELNLNPSIIKYHTEGTELDCLKSSKNTIINNKPLIMASLYHNRDGLCDTIFYFMTTHKDYRYYLRLHSYQGTGLFLYALPNKL